MRYDMQAFRFECDKCSEQSAIVYVADNKDIKPPKGWKTTISHSYCGDHYCDGHDNEVHICPKCSAKKRKTNART